MKTIAVIDDDVYIGDVLEKLLTGAGYEVKRAYSGTEAVYLLSGNQPDLILLDLMLPGLSGEEILSKIKDIPVIVLSAKADVQNKVRLLLGGAADYMTKPFDSEELLARVAVQLRNAGRNQSDVLTFESLSLNNASHSFFVGDVPVKLTKTEYAIIKLLMINAGQVITKSAILDEISEDTPDCVESSLKVHISNLRKKIREAGGKDYIEAVWGIGFKLREDAE
ncbi:MAG: response regulator transcription factor [Lachnospiraceae bacterium]|nr:response regulator transcription factor [Lachnospiraceae bacterium]